MSKSLDLPIPDQNTLEQRFSFIQNQLLRENITISFRYIIFLLALEEEYSLPGPISYSVYKDMILHTATVVESCLHYCLSMYLEKGLIKSEDVMPSEWKEDSCVQLYKIDDTHNVSGVIKHKRYEKFTSKTQFQTLNKALLESGLLTENLYIKVEKLREMRNKIHLAGLLEKDDFYEKKDTLEAFDFAKLLIERVEDKLSSREFTSNIVDVPRGTTKSILLELNKILQNNHGNDQLTLIFHNSTENRKLKLPFGINYSASLKKEIAQLLKIESIKE